MIIFTKLICGRGTVSEVIKSSQVPIEEVRPDLIRFSTQRRPIVMWNCTNSCNLSCKHCYLAAGPQLENELTTAEALQMIDELTDMKIPLLGLTGGEPLVREDLCALAEYAVDGGLRVIVSSNGTLIDEKRAKEMKRVGVHYVGISLDGASPEMHDDFREMPGSFDDAIRGIRACTKVGLKTGIRVTLTKRSYPDIPAILKLAKKLGVPRLCFYYLVPSGRGKEITKWDLTLGQRKNLLDFLYSEAKISGEDVEILTVDGPMDGVYILQRLKEERPEMCDDISRLLELSGGCSAGNKICGIGPDGSVHPCQFMTEVTVGSIRERSLDEIWKDTDNEILNMFRDRDRLKGKCGRCEYRAICGGCRIRAYQQFDDYLQEDPVCFYTPVDAEEK